MEGRQGRRQGNLRSSWLGSLQPFVPFPTPLPLAPSLILSCLPLPRKSPPLPGEAPLPPPRRRRRWRGRWRGSGTSGKLWRIFPSGRPPHCLTSKVHSGFCLDLRREGLSWGKVRAWLRSSPAVFRGEERVRNRTGAKAVRKKEFCPSPVRSPRADESSVSRLSFSRCP